MLLKNHLISSNRLGPGVFFIEQPLAMAALSKSCDYAITQFGKMS